MSSSRTRLRERWPSSTTGCGKRMKITQRHAVEENHRLIDVERVMYKQIIGFKANLDSRDIVCLNPNWEQVSQKRGLKTKGLPLILLLNTLGTTRRPAV